MHTCMNAVEMLEHDVHSIFNEAQKCQRMTTSLTILEKWAFIKSSSHAHTQIDVHGKLYYPYVHLVLKENLVLLVFISVCMLDTALNDLFQATALAHEWLAHVLMVATTFILSAHSLSLRTHTPILTFSLINSHSKNFSAIKLPILN